MAPCGPRAAIRHRPGTRQDIDCRARGRRAPRQGVLWAFLRGNRPTVVADACATGPLRSVAGELPAVQVHRAALATIADLYGVVVPTAADLG